MISVILPAYNERKNVPLLLVEIHEALGSREHEILLVDDDSPDGTAEVVKEMRLPYVQIVPRCGPRGFAASIFDGVVAAHGDLLVVMDSDFNHQPKYLPFMIENLKYYDCVSASRFLYGGWMDGRVRFKASWIFNIFTRALTGGQVTDSLYGFFAIRREVLAQCPLERIFWGYGDYCIRLMFFLQKMNAAILQFPAVNGRRLGGEPNSRLLGVLLQYTREVLRLVWSERLFKNDSRNPALPDLRQQESD